mgnify:CR=1 FL=1
MAKPKNQKPPFALRALAAFAVTLAALFVLLLAAYALPGEPVRDHVYDSAVKIAGEGLYPEYLNFKLFQMDNYTDTIMLTEAASADEAPPLTAMMTNTAYNVDNFETLADDLQWYIERDWAAGAQRTDAPALVPFSYARYWHGYLIWLRPLLLVTDITGVRVVQYLVLAALFAAVAVLLRRRCGLRAAVWFAVSQLLVTAFWAPHQVQFFTCFAVAYAGCVWVLAKPRRSDDVCLALLVLGVVTSFCDLLVTPVLTLGLPLVCWLLEPQQRLRAGTRQCGIVVGGSLTWGVGYLLCWASKWVRGRACHRAERYRRRAASGGRAHCRRQLARHGIDLGEYFTFCIHDTGGQTPVLAAGAGCRSASGAVCSQHPGQAAARTRTAAGALRADGPGVVHRAAHPQHPARLVHLARTGTDRLCGAGVFVLLL